MAGVSGDRIGGLRGSASRRQREGRQTCESRCSGERPRGVESAHREGMMAGGCQAGEGDGTSICSSCSCPVSLTLKQSCLCARLRSLCHLSVSIRCPFLHSAPGSSLSDQAGRGAETGEVALHRAGQLWHSVSLTVDLPVMGPHAYARSPSSSIKWRIKKKWS